MNKPNARPSRVATWVSRSLWLIVLVPVLGISAYSLFYVARYLGVPPWIAISMSTCFDGTALLCADYSLKYAQVGLGGSGPRAIVRIVALVAAYLQTLHARIGHEPPGSWLIWASLPILAVIIFEVHIRWQRRAALARMGVTYPAPLPAFGLISWLLFPWTTLTSLRQITERRSAAIKAAALKRSPLPSVNEENHKVIAGRVDSPNPKPQPKQAISSNANAKVRPHPKLVRAWAKANGIAVSDRARLPAALYDQYLEAHGREEETA